VSEEAQACDAILKACRELADASLTVTVFIASDGIVTASFSGPLDQTTLDHYLGLIGA